MGEEPNNTPCKRMKVKLVTTFRIPVKGHKTGRRRIICERKRREGNYLFIQINEITVEPERQQKAQKEHIQRLMESMERIGLISPITLDAKYKLIAGLHRLEAAKALGWDEIECAVRTVDGLEAELVEIDENVVRKDISGVEYGKLLLRRKELYEALHPETANGGDRRSHIFRSKKCRTENVKTFTMDTAEKLGVTQRTVERQLQTARNLTEEAAKILQDSSKKLTKEATAKLSRLEPAQQEEAASMLVQGTIKSVDEYLRQKVASAPKGGKKTAQAKSATPLKSPKNPPKEATQAEFEATPPPKHSATVGRDTGQAKTPLKRPKSGAEEAKRTELKATSPPKHSATVGRNAGQAESQATSPLEYPKNDAEEAKRTELKAALPSKRSMEESQKAEPPETKAAISQTSTQEPKAIETPPPFKLDGKRYATFAESVADLKNVDKDVRCTPDIFLAEITETINRIRNEFACYRDPSYQEAFPDLTNVQFQYLQGIVNGLRSDLTSLLNLIKGMKKFETP